MQQIPPDFFSSEIPELFSTVCFRLELSNRREGGNGLIRRGNRDAGKRPKSESIFGQQQRQENPLQSGRAETTLLALRIGFGVD